MSRQCIVLTLRHRDYGITVTGRFEVYTQGPRRLYRQQDTGSVLLGEKWEVI